MADGGYPMTDGEEGKLPISVNQIGYLRNFICIADKCEDTCCRGWGMQVDPKRLELFKEKAPELLDKVTSGETEHIMKRDDSGSCLQLDQNHLCGIQNKYGTDFLPDACHFYPRITRKFGEQHYVSASMSCPEIARLALYGEEDFGYFATETGRLPENLKDYLTGSELDIDSALYINQKFKNLANDKLATPERIITRIVWLANALHTIPKANWRIVIDSLVMTMEGALPQPTSAAADPFNLLNILAGLAVSTRKPMSERLKSVIASIELALGVRVNWQKMTVERMREQSYPALQEEYYRTLSPLTAAPLRRWIQSSVTAATFPFGGLGNDPYQRAIIIAVRFATLKLAIMSNMPQFLAKPQETMVYLSQSLARFLDHLAAPEVSIACYEEAGWLNLSRIMGLVGDS